MSEDSNKNEKMAFKDRLKDKKERTKLELMGYLIFFAIVFIFVKVSSIETSKKEVNVNSSEKSFFVSLTDNYEYEAVLDYNGVRYDFRGKKIGNNGKIVSGDNDYYVMNNNYYVLNDGNYLLITKEELGVPIDYGYLEASRIKKYLTISEKKGNVYTLKIANIILNSSNENVITMEIDEESKSIFIDYTSLFKEVDDSVNNVNVSIRYFNIDKLTSLEE